MADMLLIRAINFAAFVVACIALTGVHFAWLAGGMSEAVMGMWSGVALVGMLGTIIAEHRLAYAPRGFDVEIQ
jgi:hypothetical protein